MKLVYTASNTETNIYKTKITIIIRYLFVFHNKPTLRIVCGKISEKLDFQSCDTGQKML